MDKSLVIEYWGNKQWFTYDLFSSINYEQADSLHPKYSQQIHLVRRKIQIRTKSESMLSNLFLFIILIKKHYKDSELPYSTLSSPPNDRDFAKLGGRTRQRLFLFFTNLKKIWVNQIVLICMSILTIIHILI